MRNEALDLLIKDVYEFNDWRLANAKAELDFSNSVFDDMDLAEAFLFGIKLQNCSFRNTNLQEAIFSNSLLDNTNFTNANLEFAVFGAVELYNIKVRELFGADLVKGASLKGCIFHHARLSNASFVETNIEKADFSHADLNSAKFLNTNYQEAIFTEADKTGTIFHNNF